MNHRHALIFIVIIYFSSSVTSLKPTLLSESREIARSALGSIESNSSVAPSLDSSSQNASPPLDSSPSAGEPPRIEPSSGKEPQKRPRTKRRYDLNDQRKRSDYEPAYGADSAEEDSAADEGFCVMGNTCGAGGGIAGDSSIPCHAPRRPATVNDTEALATLRNICPDIFANSDNPAVCCTADQIRETDQNLASPRDLGMGKCPSCYHNFRNLHCNMICSPRQHRFLQVINRELVDEAELARSRAKSRDDEDDDEESDKAKSGGKPKEETDRVSSPESANKTAGEQYAILEVNYFLDREFVIAMYESCKNVKSVMGGMLIDVSSFFLFLFKKRPF